ncbi:MAG TPA: DUF222 domain-containing protein [Amnibacterium sp.]|uniref:HNH endonuclease signature motif containing protein n=1 Tax=Amnibacterium sp. TaxID=1872496 RepID=UPI002F94CD7D
MAETEAWEAIGRLIDARRIAAAAEIEVRSAPARGDAGLAFVRGRKDAADLIADLARVGLREAKRRIGIGLALQPRLTLAGDEVPGRYPELAAAVQAGEVGLESARIIVETLHAVRRRADPEQVPVAEAALTEVACEVGPELLRIHADTWRAYLDPDGAEPDEDEQHRKRSFTLGREGLDGMTPFRGLAAAEDAAVIRAALHSVRRGVHWQREDCDDSEDLETGWRETEGERRSKAQFDFDTVLALLKAGMSASDDAKAGPTKPGHEVIVTTSLADLQAGRGCGSIDGVGARISIPSVERLACGGGLRLLVTGEAGEPLVLGRTERLFTAAQRKALVVRFGGCAYPGCTAPAAWTEAHHIQWWHRDDGGTDVLNGVLLCAFHHHLVHAKTFQHEIRVHNGFPHLVPKRWNGPPEPRHRMQTRPRGAPPNEAKAA